ncbi:MAG: dipeptidase [Lachnospiraceae bacterium]|nr:dipeptidase [Lachnospiraceae bacterium]
MKVVDMHCDTISELLEHKKIGWTLADNDMHLRLDKMEAGDYLLQNFALFVNLGRPTDPYEQAMILADCFDEQMKQFGDRISQVRSFADIEKNRAEGKISAMLTIEEGGVCKGSLEKLRKFYDRGVRMMTLTWNYPNEIGHPNAPMSDNIEADPDYSTPEVKKGLTELGIDFVEEMQKMGMIVDVSHLSDAGFWDVVKYTKKPFVASHSNARAVCKNVRNLTDEMIRALAEKGGVTGLNFCSEFLEDFQNGIRPAGTISSVVDHAKHIVNVGGIECLGLGSDFDGITTHAELTGGDKLPLLDDALAKGGFSAAQREKIFSGNVLRLYKEVL